MKTDAHWGKLDNINQPGKHHRRGSVEIWKLERIKIDEYTAYLLCIAVQIQQCLKKVAFNLGKKPHFLNDIAEKRLIY